MTHNPDIDLIFESCRRGDLDAKSIDNITSLRNTDGKSLLAIAIVNKHVSIIEQLLKHDFMATDADRNAILCAAGESGDISVFQLVLDKAGCIPPGAMDRILRVACSEGYVDIVRVVLSRRTSISTHSLNSYLLFGCQSGHAEIVRGLINAGADAHLNPDGEFFIDAIYRLNRKVDTMQPVIDVLIEANCVVNPDIFNFWDRIGGSGAVAFTKQYLYRLDPHENSLKICIYSACQFNDPDMIKCLCDYSEDRRPDVMNFQQINEMAQSLVYWKNYFTDTSGIDYLLTRYGHLYDDPNVLMFHAAAAGSVKMLTGYLANGKCDVNVVFDIRQYRYFQCYRFKSLANATVLSVASDPAVIQLLLDAKADVNPPGCASVLTAALANNRLDAVNVLIEAGASLEAACAGDPSLLLGAATVMRDSQHVNGCWRQDTAV
jgi:ankyrin repeat protein